MSLRHNLIRLGLLLGALALSFILGRRCANTPDLEAENIRVDTLVVTKTITQEKPIYTRVCVRDSIYVVIRDTAIVRDTIWLPREVKVYEDERYRAEVSGYQPSLDKIDIFVQEKVVTRDVTQVVSVKKPTRWGVGVQVGYGFQLGEIVTASPYIGVGISYNFLSF